MKAVVAQPASAAVEAPAVEAPAVETAAPRLRPRFLHAPVRKQLILIVLAASFGGAIAGIIEADLGHQGWPLMAGLAIVILAASSIAKRWLIAPIERLVQDVRDAGTSRRPTKRWERGMDDTNEIDLLSEQMHQLSVEAYRQSTAVNHLRRTLDHRIAAATRKATQQLEQMALRDPLTDLANRRFVQEHLEPLIATCRAANTDVLCVAIDMDNFKQVNDKLGHAKGDELLKFLAHLLRSNIRAEDYAVRLGGDEFLIFMPGSEREKAAEFLDRIRRLFAQHVRIAIPGGQAVGLSFGVSSLRRDQAPTGAALMKHADENLYAAKTAGKGRVVGLD